jgi:hypothetical protein
MPVMPGDESLEYLITQAIADFLASDAENPIDGIIYPSVQVQGKSNNIVLFNKASRVLGIKLPKEIEVETHLGHWDDYEVMWVDHYSVFENIITDQEPKVKDEYPNQLLNIDMEALLSSMDERVPALKVDLEDITVQ